MTEQIADEISRKEVRGVLVIAEAEHLCMKMRSQKWEYYNDYCSPRDYGAERAQRTYTCPNL